MAGAFSSAFSSAFDAGAGGGVSGTLAVTLGGVTLAGAGTVTVQGSAAVTLGAVGVSASGTVAVAGALGVTLGPVGAAASGTVGLTGSLAVTLGPVTASAAGVVPVTGSLGVTLGGVGLVAAGQGPGVTGALAITLGGVALAATGTVTDAAPLPPPVVVLPAGYDPLVVLAAGFCPVVAFAAEVGAVDIPVGRENHWRGSKVAYRFDIKPSAGLPDISGWSGWAQLYDRRGPEGVLLMSWPLAFDNAVLSATALINKGDTNGIGIAQGWLLARLSTGEPIGGVHFEVSGPPVADPPP